MRYLLMGGQACVFYGAAEFSRDLDLAVLLDETNLARLRKALAELDAYQIAVPPFDPALLARGHAVHFRCRRDDVAGLRIDIMARLRGVAAFEDLWNRRTTDRSCGRTGRRAFPAGSGGSEKDAKGQRLADDSDAR